MELFVFSFKLLEILNCIKNYLSFYNITCYLILNRIKYDVTGHRIYYPTRHCINAFSIYNNV